MPFGGAVNGRISTIECWSGRGSPMGRFMLIAVIDLPAGNGNMIVSLQTPVARHPNGLADSRRDADPRRIARRVVSIVLSGHRRPTQTPR